ncbi:cytochrome P450 [Podospora appendiculata]|uniref:Cytochrome P450 n=1 Tax=Podospora appendiculata TaxID=314037 RepID=A0AAE1CG38_9PEZI|nr:cytochrome P450 [Podospora appendiculata]
MLDPMGLISISCLAYVIYQILLTAYNLWFHPLRRHPGPWRWAASRIPLTTSTIRGRYVHDIKDMHRKYGHVVRIAPNELSFTDERAWADICGATSAAPYGMKKDERLNDLVGGDATNPDLAREKSDMKHTRLRKALSPAFSKSSLRQQETLIAGHVDEMVAVLGQSETQGQKVNMVHVYAFTIYDIFSQLFLGESMDLLRQDTARPWVDSMTGFAKATTAIAALSHYTIARVLITIALKFLGTGPRDAFMDPCFRRFDRRMESTSTSTSTGTTAVAQPDLVHFALSGKTQLTSKELRDFSPFLMIGGGETMASLLPCLTYLLLKHPKVLSRLVCEVRNAFGPCTITPPPTSTCPTAATRTTTPLTMDAVLGLPYLAACINEALRLYPPVVQGNERVVPAGGAVVCGAPLPGGALVVASHLATYRQKRNFFRPDHYLPERWLPAEAGAEFAGDRKGAFKPFSVGPQSCFGQEIAHYTMRLVVCKLLLTFDLSLCPESDDKEAWGGDLAAYNVWMKPALMVKLKRVTGT